MAEAFSDEELKDEDLEYDILDLIACAESCHDWREKTRIVNDDYIGRFRATITARDKRIEEAKEEGYMEGFNDRLFSGESEFAGQADEINRQFLETQRKKRFEASTIKYFRKFFEFRIEKLKARIKVLSHWLDSYRLEHGSVPDTVKWEEIINKRKQWKIEDDNKLIADQTAEIGRLRGLTGDCIAIMEQFHPDMDAPRLLEYNADLSGQIEIAYKTLKQKE